MDSTTKTWFGGVNVDVAVSQEISGLFDDRQIVELSGAANGSKVTATLTDIGVRLEVASLVMKRDTHLIQRQDGGWHILNAHVRVHSEYSGRNLAARSLVIQARAALALDFTSIDLYAAGNLEMAYNKFPDDRWVGYWVWPRLGFDADIPQHVLHQALHQAPRGLQNARRIADLIGTPEGLDFWRVQGDSVDVSFDLAHGSRSWENLACYTAHRNITV